MNGRGEKQFSPQPESMPRKKFLKLVIAAATTAFFMLKTKPSEKEPLQKSQIDHLNAIELDGWINQVYGYQVEFDASVDYAKQLTCKRCLLRVLCCFPPNFFQNIATYDSPNIDPTSTGQKPQAVDRPTVRFLVDGEYAGTQYLNLTTIYLNNNSEQSLPGTILHELGHRMAGQAFGSYPITIDPRPHIARPSNTDFVTSLHRRIAHSLDPDLYSVISGDPNNFSEYATSYRAEDLAEHFMQLIENPWQVLINFNQHSEILQIKYLALLRMLEEITNGYMDKQYWQHRLNGQVDLDYWQKKEPTIHFEEDHPPKQIFAIDLANDPKKTLPAVIEMSKLPGNNSDPIPKTERSTSLSVDLPSGERALFRLVPDQMYESDSDQQWTNLNRILEGPGSFVITCGIDNMPPIVLAEDLQSDQIYEIVITTLLGKITITVTPGIVPQLSLTRVMDPVEYFNYSDVNLLTSINTYVESPVNRAFFFILSSIAVSSQLTLPSLPKEQEKKQPDTFTRTFDRRGFMKLMLGAGAAFVVGGQDHSKPFAETPTVSMLMKNFGIGGEKTVLDSEGRRGKREERNWWVKIFSTEEIEAIFPGISKQSRITDITATADLTSMHGKYNQEPVHSLKIDHTIIFATNANEIVGESMVTNTQRFLTAFLQDLHINYPSSSISLILFPNPYGRNLFGNVATASILPPFQHAPLIFMIEGNNTQPLYAMFNLNKVAGIDSDNLH